MRIAYISVSFSWRANKPEKLLYFYFLPRLISGSWGCWELSYRTAFPHLLPPVAVPAASRPSSVVTATSGASALHTRWQEPPPRRPRRTPRGSGGRGATSILFRHERERERGHGKGDGREGLCREIPRNGICTFYDRSDGNATELYYYSLILLSHFPPSSLLPSSLGNTETYKQIPPHEK